jgi:hypothetical protein
MQKGRDTMRSGIAIILIIFIMLAAGGLIVDERYIRQDYKVLQADKQQADQQLAQAKEQITQFTNDIQAYQSQAAKWEQERTVLSNRIAELENQNQELQKSLNALQPVAPVPGRNVLLAFSTIGLLGIATSTGVITVKKLRRADQKRLNASAGNPRTLTVRITERELAKLIEQRRNS